MARFDDMKVRAASRSGAAVGSGTRLRFDPDTAARHPWLTSFQPRADEDPAHPAGELWARLGALALAALSVVLAAGVFARMMTYEMRRDEELYVPPARLLDDLSPYRDFFYNHTPGSAWWFHLVRTVTGSDHLLFDGRIGVFAGWALFAAAIGLLAWRLTRSPSLAWSVTVLGLCNETFLTQTGMSATNNFLPLPLSFAGLALLVLALGTDRPRPGLAAGAGVLLSLATVVKISAVAFVPPAVLAVLLLPRAATVRQRLVGGLLPLGIGGLVGGLPILTLLATDRERFLAHVLGYHLGPHAQYYRSGAAPDEGAVMSLGGKLALAHDIWLGGALAAALTALGVVAALRFLDRRERTGQPGGPNGLWLLAPGVFLLAAAFSFLPTPSFPQYYAPPLLALPLALILLCAGLSPARLRQAKRVLLAASLVALATQAPRLLQGLPGLVSPGRWTVNRVHADGVRMAQALAEAGAGGRVATLAPVYPLEGGLPVYPELATGLFAYRTGDITRPELARFYKMTSPATVGALLAAEPPAALLLGFAPDLERPMLDYALREGYRPDPAFAITDRYGTARLYLKPVR